MIYGYGDRVVQEFYCRHCPADDPKSSDPEKRKVGGHFRVRIALGYNASLKIHCPKCKHVHSRGVENGQIVDRSVSSSYTDDIKAPIATWSREPVARVAAEKKQRNLEESPGNNYHTDIRGGTIIATPEDLTEAARGARNRPVAVFDLFDPDSVPKPQESKNAGDT